MNELNSLYMEEPNYLLAELRDYHMGCGLKTPLDDEALTRLSMAKCDSKSELKKTIKSLHKLEQAMMDCGCAMSAAKIGAELAWKRNQIANTIFGEGFLVRIYNDLWEKSNEPF